jgi:hypothetical protein
MSLKTFLMPLTATSNLSQEALLAHKPTGLPY